MACGFGLPLPEDIILFALGYLSFTGSVDLTASIFVALAGVLVGDSTIYFIGRLFGERVLKIPLFRRVLTAERLDSVRDTFHANGSVYLFFARFTPGLRAVTFWSAGLFKIPFRTFFLLDGTAAIISVPALTYLAYALGSAFHEYIGSIRDGVAIFGIAAIAVVVVVTVVRRRRKRGLKDAQR